MNVRRNVAIALILVVLPFLLVGAAVAIAESEWAEGWIERRAASGMGREVDIEAVDIELGWPPAVNLERLRIGNPAWAKTPSLIDAEGVRAVVELPPLLQRKAVIPVLSARKAIAGLEVDEPRATWRFGGPDGDQGESAVFVRRVLLGNGRIVYRDVQEKTALDVDVTGSLGRDGELKLKASGRFRDEPAKATARLPSLELMPTAPIRLEANAEIGRTQIAATGSVASSLDTLDLELKLSGSTLSGLRKVFRMNLPDTPPYRVAGRLRHTGAEWVYDPFDGRVGDSDVAGNVIYRTGGKRPFLQARLTSKLLDFDDLGPIIGAPPATGAGETASPTQREKAAALAKTTRSLPDDSFGTARWDEMDADVRLDAKRVLRPKELPIDTLSTHVTLDNSILKLQPLSFGVAGGRVSSNITLDGRAKPMRGDMQVDVQGLKLARLFPEQKTMKDALGTLYGRAKLTGRGESVADLLGSSNGQINLAVDGGQISLLLVELLGLDLAEAVTLLGTRNRQVTLRCAIADLPVKDGVMQSQAFVIDTSDTLVNVTGSISLQSEQLALVFRPEPKDTSIFALRSPIHLKGPFKDPSVRPEAGPIVARVAGAVVLGSINPLLALLPFIETGPGKDSDCAKALADLRSKGVVKKKT
ncbi:MAG TPA: AsmA family protein [Casimicrobiaceae bacterium]|nr:AsmA family protein [Casimicrobiaceae bacterium]